MSIEAMEATLLQAPGRVHLQVLHGPAVLRALGYKELCVVAKGEEKHLSELK